MFDAILLCATKSTIFWISNYCWCGWLPDHQKTYGHFTWNLQVKSILKDENYIGNSVHNRQSTVSFKNKKVVRKPESECFRVENTHEAIITKEMFLQVQEQIDSRRRVCQNGQGLGQWEVVTAVVKRRKQGTKCRKETKSRGDAGSAMEQTETDAEKWVELIKQYSNPTERTTELLNTLIKKIVVHEAVKGTDGVCAVS